MQPELIITPFGESADPATVRDIPKSNPSGAPRQNASWEQGFPLITMTPIAAGGIPPEGPDMNGVLRAISRHASFVGGGGQYKWSAEYVAAKGGYPKGAVIQADNGEVSYVSTEDGNSTNFNAYPDSIGKQWVFFGGATSYFELQFEQEQEKRENEFNQFLINTAFEMPPIPFVEGSILEVSRPTQLVSHEGQLYSVRMPASFPVILSDIWDVAVASLTPRSDEALRQQLASPTGAQLITTTAPGAGAKPRPLPEKLKETVSIFDYYDPTDPTDNLVDGFARAYAAGKCVEVPADANLQGLNAAVPIPDKRDLAMYGDISGTGVGRFLMQGSGQFFNQGGLLTNVGLWLQGGSPRVEGFRFTGRNHTQAILIQGVGSDFRNLKILDGEIFGANFGILRQGAGSTLSGAQISKFEFFDMRGDCIEWNVSAGDKNIQITNHIIDLVSSVSSAQPFWGIGIGVAGSSYDNSYPDSKTVKDFVIADIVGSRCRQLIHVENGNRFEVADIHGYDISDAYSPLSGLAHRTVVVNGSTNFSVSCVKSYAGTTGTGIAGAVAVEYGIVGGNYVSAPQNYTVSGITIDRGSVILNTGNSGSFAEARDITLSDGRFEVFERPGKLVLKNIKATRKRADGKAIILNLDYNADGRQAFRAGRPSSIEMTDCVGLDEYMADSCSVTGMVQDKVMLKGNNFDAEARANGTTPIARDVNRTMQGPSNGPPYGHEFVRTDMFIDSVTGVRYLFTGAGSLNRGSDTFQANGANSKFVRQTGSPTWTSAFTHEVGQRITLSNIGPSGGPLVTTVVRAFQAGGFFQLELSDAHSAADGTAGVITATVTATYVLA